MKIQLSVMYVYAYVHSLAQQRALIIDLNYLINEKKRLKYKLHYFSFSKSMNASSSYLQCIYIAMTVRKYLLLISGHNIVPFITVNIFP